MTEDVGAGTTIGARLGRVLIALVMVPIAGIPVLIALAVDSAVIAWLAANLAAADPGAVFAWSFGVQAVLGFVIVTPAAVVMAWKDEDDGGRSTIAGALMLGLAALVLIGLLGCAADKSDDDASAGAGGETGPTTHSGNEDNPPTADVSLDNCAAGAAGWITASGVITNNSSKASNYLVSVEFLDGAGTRYAEGVATANGVAPGQRVEYEAPGFTDPRDGTTCRVVSVDRYAA